MPKQTYPDPFAHIPTTYVTGAVVLGQSGLTVPEIMAETGQTRAQVEAELDAAGVPVVNTKRLERALFEEAAGGTTWKESVSAEGVVRLMADRRPNVAAARALLEVHDPERYGKEAGGVTLLVVDRLAYKRSGDDAKVIEHNSDA